MSIKCPVCNTVFQQLPNVVANAPKQTIVEQAIPHMDDPSITWSDQIPTSKGPWEKTTDLDNPEVQKMVGVLKSLGRATKHDGAIYWLLTDRYDKSKVFGIGRR